MPRSAPTEKLAVNSERRGQMKFDTAYTATEAARMATKLAKAGWKVTVQLWGHGGTRRGILMTCTPATGRRRQTATAHCTVTPAFKKRIKWRKQRR